MLDGCAAQLRPIRAPACVVRRVLVAAVMEAVASGIRLSKTVVIDVCAYELWSDGQRVSIEPKPLELLVYLVRHRQRIVSKAELLDTLWRDCNVSEVALSRAVYIARNALRACVSPSCWIRNVRGRGYQFVDTPASTSERPHSCAALEQRLDQMGALIEQMTVELRETQAMLAALYAVDRRELPGTRSLR